MQDAEMGGIPGGKMDLVVRGGAEWVVAGLEPLKAHEGEPAVRFQKIRDMLGTPGEQVALPRRVLSEAWQAEKSAQKSNCEHLGARSSKREYLGEKTVGRHGSNYIACPPCRASPRTSCCPPSRDLAMLLCSLGGRSFSSDITARTHVRHFERSRPIFSSPFTPVKGLACAERNPSCTLRPLPSSHLVCHPETIRRGWVKDLNFHTTDQQTLPGTCPDRPGLAAGRVASKRMASFKPKAIPAASYDRQREAPHESARCTDSRRRLLRHALLHSEGSGKIEGLLRPNSWRESDQAGKSLLHQA